MKKTAALLALSASLSLPAWALDKSRTDNDAFPAVTEAIKDAEAALKALNSARTNLGDHSLAASTALNTALVELKAGLSEAKASTHEKRPAPALPTIPAGAPVSSGTISSAPAPLPVTPAPTTK